VPGPAVGIGEYKNLELFRQLLNRGAQIVNLLKQLQHDFGLTYLFISHSMPVVRYLCDRIAVMRRGEIVEIGPAEEITSRPRHEYTRTLLAATPEPEFKLT